MGIPDGRFSSQCLSTSKQTGHSQVLRDIFIWSRTDSIMITFASGSGRVLLIRCTLGIISLSEAAWVIGVDSNMKNWARFSFSETCLDSCLVAEIV